MIILKSTWIAAAFSLIMSGMIYAGSAAVLSPSPIDRFAGHYILVKDQSEDVGQAIRRATEGMNFLLRTVARRQLRQKAVSYPSFAMERSGESFSTSLAGEPALSLPLSGTAVLWNAPDGETVRVHLQPGPELVQVFEAKQGRRENHFALSSNRQVLTMNIKLTSSQLPKPVEYRLVYQRL